MPVLFPSFPVPGDRRTLFLLRPDRDLLTRMPCPCCGSCRWEAHSSYRRYVFSLVQLDERGLPARENRSDCTPIRTYRYRCRQCRHVYAFLPDILVPHSPYSLLFRLQVLGSYSRHKVRVQEILDRFCISRCQLFSWKKQLPQYVYRQEQGPFSLERLQGYLRESLCSHSDSTQPEAGTQTGPAPDSPSDEDWSGFDFAALLRTLQPAGCRFPTGETPPAPGSAPG